MFRTLGRSGIEVAAVGIGTWALGGPFASGNQQLGYGTVDDEQSVAALRRAVDLGATFIDTADVYGTGHAERIIARAVGDHRDELIWASKWGNVFDAARRQIVGSDPSPQHARAALEASLRRLGTDRLDVWQLHISDMEPALAEDLVALCEELVDDGLIRTYGWSTDDPARAEVFAKGPRCSTVEHMLNVLDDAPEMLAICDKHDLGSIVRSPLAMGLLSEKVTEHTILPEDDVRHHQPEWLRWFTGGRPAPELLRRRDAVRDLLESGGRTLAQGALAWVLARSPRSVPIPGIRTVAQAEENIGVLQSGALTAQEFAEVERQLRPA